MKISLEWLSDFIDLTETDPQKIADRVTTGVAEVDDVIVQGSLLRDCCVGKVLKIQKHPNADRLSICQVETDRGAKRVVCGGTNVRVGMRVAFAHTGATVRWHGTEMMTLAKTKIRGEDSEGMICAAEELDLQSMFPQATDHSIIDLGDGDADVGKNLKEYLGLNDVVLHVDNHAITNRPDLFSHLGFAREFVALGLATWKKKPAAKKFTFPKTKLPFRCVNDIPDLIPRYRACLVEIDGMGETPAWMKKRLEATGWRSLNLPVDITNYVAMETGMPLHSFDADDIRGDMHMRTSTKGESITTLDEVVRKLPEGAIVISDDAGIFDLLGIMGGLRSSTKETTKRIFLHAAVVDPASIRRGIIGTGHRTDASTVYEKGIPRVVAGIGFDRALELLLELVPGARIASQLEEWGDDGKKKPIALSLDRVTSMLGITVPEKTIKKILSDLEFDVKAGKKGELAMTSPLHRRDVNGQHDLIEEIGRVAGYNEIPPTMPTVMMHLPHRTTRIHQLRDGLEAQRFFEIQPISLVSPALLTKCQLDPARAVQIQNPIGEETSLLHMSTLPSLLEHAERNILESSQVLRTFHWGHVFEKGKPERAEMSLLVAGMHDVSDESLHDDPFLLLKHDLAAALSSLGATLDVDTGGSAPPYAHPGRFAQLTLRGETKNGDESPSHPLGMIFEVHPDVRARFSLPHRAAAAVIDLESLLAAHIPPTVGTTLPQFPTITYDTTLTLSSKQQSGELLKMLRTKHEWIEAVEIADLYSGKPLESGTYNVTLRITYRAPDRTLKEEEVKPVHEKILQSV